MKPTRLLLTALLITASLVARPAPASAQTFAIRQLDYFDHDGLVEPNTEWAQFDVTYDPGSDAQWLNVVLVGPAGPSVLSAPWIVRNHPLLAIADVGPDQRTSSTYFDLGIIRGVDVTGLPIGILVSITSQPLTAAPTTGEFVSLVIGRFQNLVNKGVPSGDNAVNPPSPDLFEWSLPGLDFKAVIYKGMPNVVQESHFCGPGAAANSLHFLKPGGLDQTLEETQSELAKNMANNNDGNWDDAEASGKLKFVKDKKLDLELHYTGGEKLPKVGDFVDPGGNGVARNDGAFSCKWLADQLMMGQDVELMTRTHWVVVAGVIRWGDVCIVIFRDDPFQKGAATTAMQKAEIAKRYVVTRYDGSDGTINLGNGREPLLTALAESPKKKLWVPASSTASIVVLALLLAAALGIARNRRRRPAAG
ncbi:MAG: hypothetical protein D6696_01025 [Acidobacteria bacterium]|nr:MAG: hypothetical protein D6696_01025 [Acidobacteriota bacterium]